MKDKDGEFIDNFGKKTERKEDRVDLDMNGKIILVLKKLDCDFRQIQLS